MTSSIRLALVAFALSGLAWPWLGCGDDAQVVAQQVRDYVSNVSSGDGTAQGALVEGAPPAPSGGPEAFVTVDSANLALGGRLTATVSADVPFATILVQVQDADDHYAVALASPVTEAVVVLDISEDLGDSEFSVLFAVVADMLVGPFTSVSIQVDIDGPSDDPYTLACSTGTGGEVYVLDPDTGDATPVGVLDGIANWSEQIVLDRTGTLAHIIGYADLQASMRDLHTIDLTTGESSTAPVNRLYILAGTTEGGDVVAVTRGIESVAEASVFLVDPETGTATPAGTLGPAAWIGDAGAAIAPRYDAASDTVYALSQNDESVTDAIWALSLADGTQRSVAVAGSTGQIILGGVRSDGELVGLDVTRGAPRSVVTLDPATGDVSESIEVTGLGSTNGRLTFDPFAEVAYVMNEPFGEPTTLMYRVDLAGSAASSVETQACTLAVY